jgi:hypothetical protein
VITRKLAHRRSLTITEEINEATGEIFWRVVSRFFEFGRVVSVHETRHACDPLDAERTAYTWQPFARARLRAPAAPRPVAEVSQRGGDREPSLFS